MFDLPETRGHAHSRGSGEACGSARAMRGAQGSCRPVEPVGIQREPPVARQGLGVIADSAARLTRPCRTDRTGPTAARSGLLRGPLLPQGLAHWPSSSLAGQPLLVSSLWPPHAATRRGQPTRSRAACSAVGRTKSPENTASRQAITEDLGWGGPQRWASIRPTGP